jgi:hypothetical protein
MMKIEISGSGSISQRHGSADPDPHQNVMDPEHCSQAIWDICERLYGERLDLQSWRRKIQGEGADQEETVVLSEEYDHTKGKKRVSLKKQV